VVVWSCAWLGAILNIGVGDVGLGWMIFAGKAQGSDWFAFATCFAAAREHARKTWEQQLLTVTHIQSSEWQQQPQ